MTMIRGDAHRSRGRPRVSRTNVVRRMPAPTRPDRSCRSRISPSHLSEDRCTQAKDDDERLRWGSVPEGTVGWRWRGRAGKRSGAPRQSSTTGVTDKALDDFRTGARGDVEYPHVLVLGYGAGLSPSTGAIGNRRPRPMDLAVAVGQLLYRERLDCSRPWWNGHRGRRRTSRRRRLRRRREAER